MLTLFMLGWLVGDIVNGCRPTLKMWIKALGIFISTLIIDFTLIKIFILLYFK